MPDDRIDGVCSLVAPTVNFEKTGSLVVEMLSKTNQRGKKVKTPCQPASCRACLGPIFIFSLLNRNIKPQRHNITLIINIAGWPLDD